MSTRPTRLRLNANELLRQPGSVKHVDAVLTGDELGLDDPRADECIAGSLAVHLNAVGTIDGVVVQGSVGVPWQQACRRCLADVVGQASIAVDEVYQRSADIAVDDDETLPFDGDQIDLVPALRELVLLGLPDGVLCRADCAGICPVCGADRNVATCACDTSVRDDRWSVLDQLRTAEPEPGS